MPSLDEVKTDPPATCRFEEGCQLGSRYGGNVLVKRLTEAQKHARRMTTRGQTYRGGHIREEYLESQRKLCDENDGTCESPKERYFNQVKDMLAYIDSIDQPLSRKIVRKLGDENSQGKETG